MQIFISHIHEERLIARTLANLLDHSFGQEVKPFLAEQIQLGDDWFIEIKNALQKSTIVLAVFSPYSIDRPWVNIEVGYAIMSGCKKVIPLCCLGLRIDQLPNVYGRFNTTDVYSKAAIHKLLKQIAAKTHAKKLVGNSTETVAHWKKSLDKIIPKSLENVYLTGKSPVVWLIGSHSTLKGKTRSKALDAVHALAEEFTKKGFCLVMGSSAMLDEVAVSVADLGCRLEKAKRTRKTFAIASASANKTYPSPNPVILLGSLRSAQGVRHIFHDAVGKIPDVAVVIGGNKSGRTPEEIEKAVEANIPVVALSFTGGVARRTESTFDACFNDDVEQIQDLNNRMDLLAESITNVILRQVEIRRRESQ